MEIKNINQSQIPIQNSIKNQSSITSVKNEKGNFLPIIGIVLLIFIVGTSAYYFGTQRSNTAQYSQNTPNPTYQSAPTNVPSPTANQSSSTSKFQYNLVKKTVKISDENIINAFYQDNPYIEISAAIEKIDPSNNQKETVVKPLSDNLLGKMIAPSGCCAKKYDILQHQAVQNDSYLLFIRDKFYIVDLKTKLISQMPTNYPKAFALQFEVSPDERFVFLKSGDRHSSNYQEVIDLTNKILYKLPEYYVGDEVFNVFKGFDKDKVIIESSKGFDKQNQPQNTVNLSTYPSKTFNFTFVTQ
ncbi:hypothetical protein HYS96_03445 [Candidatus Daviesbacteria bacterium]|nr:hypothetical protein [Candidatus Daviesbacteria bacterium]